MAGKKETKVTSKRRTQVKNLPEPVKEISKAEQKKLKGGDWLMTPAGSVRPNGNGN